MANDKVSIPVSELCQKLHRSESTIRRYVQAYQDFLDIAPQDLSDTIPRSEATKLSLIRDLKHARIKDEEIRRVLQVVQNEQLWSKIQRMGPQLRKNRQQLLEKIELLGNAIDNQNKQSKNTLKAGLQISRDILGVIGFLLALKGVFDSKKENADMTALHEMLEKHARNYNNETRKLFDRLEEQSSAIEEIKSIVSPLRSAPRTLSGQQVKAMLKARGLLDRYWNPNGRGMQHDYEKVKRRGQLLVIDHATGLSWQRNGSPHYIIKWAKAKDYVSDLNWQAYGGYSDWRLPTLEEAMSLIERTKKNGDLYIDKAFDKTQRWIWTTDKFKGASRAWVVDFFLRLLLLLRRLQ